MSQVTLGDLRSYVLFEHVVDVLDPADITTRVLDLFEDAVGDVSGSEQFKTDLRDLVPNLINSALVEMLDQQNGDHYQ